MWSFFWASLYQLMDEIVMFLLFLPVTVMVLIILSTMFLKQHSVIDVVGAIVLSFCMYGLVYFPARDYSAGTAKQKLRTRFSKISKDSTLP